jgi:hypothetical protein
MWMDSTFSKAHTCYHQAACYFSSSYYPAKLVSASEDNTVNFFKSPSNVAARIKA